MPSSLVIEAPSEAAAVDAILDGDRTLCLVLRANVSPDCTTFFTQPDFNLQVGCVVHPAGHTIPRHIHLPIRRNIVGTSEVLIVRKGGCELDVYNDDRELVATRELFEGDVMVMVAGGHEFRMREDTVLLEIKQGPYPGVKEKERF